MASDQTAAAGQRSASRSVLGTRDAASFDGVPWCADIASSNALFELYDRMVGDVEIPVVLQEIAEVVCQDLVAERASIYLIDRAADELESVAVIGNVARAIRVPIRPDSLAGYCARTGRSFVVPDAYGDLSAIDPRLRFDRRWDDINDFRTRDVMCAPATFKGELLGVVQVINSLGAPFAADDLIALETISRLVGYSLYHAKLYDDLATMKQLEKQKAEFLRIMVHELKSPVAAARMLAGLISDHQAAPPEITSISERVSSRLDQMIDMIQELLHLAKVKSGAPLGEIAIVDLTALTREGCQAYAELADGKGLGITIDAPPERVDVRGDLQGFKLVVSNLVSNAVKYTSEGEVTVRLRRDGKWAALSVTDTGMGIPEADVPKLFREFYRASNAKRLGVQGTGVGLAGAKAIVERFGGEFALETTENVGSTFTVRLPVCEEQ